MPRAETCFDKNCLFGRNCKKKRIWRQRLGLSLQSDQYSAGAEILAPKQGGNNMQIPANRQKKSSAKFSDKIAVLYCVLLKG